MTYTCHRPSGLGCPSLRNSIPAEWDPDGGCRQLRGPAHDGGCTGGPTPRFRVSDTHRVSHSSRCVLSCSCVICACTQRGLCPLAKTRVCFVWPCQRVSTGRCDARSPFLGNAHATYLATPTTMGVLVYTCATATCHASFLAGPPFNGRLVCRCCSTDFRWARCSFRKCSTRWYAPLSRIRGHTCCFILCEAQLQV